MQNLKLYGASDDLIELEGVKGADEFNVYPSGSYAGKITVKASDGAINIHVIYDGSWAFSICPQDGDSDQMPPWSITRDFGQDSRYSETIYIELPDDAVAFFSKK
jgi:hypothetical protein